MVGHLRSSLVPRVQGRDIDWVHFYAFPGEIYTIEAKIPGGSDINTDVVITLYPEGPRQASNGVLTWEFDNEGIYQAMVAPGNSGVKAYDLAVYPPTAVFPGVLKGFVMDMLTGLPI